MKRSILLLAFVFLFFTLSAQEYAIFKITETNQGVGSFTNAALSNFTWTVVGALESDVQIRDNEGFSDGSKFENEYGQADIAENLRIQNTMNGAGSAGEPIVAISSLTVEFEEVAAKDIWGFCVTDIDVENVLITAIAENDDPVSNAVIDSWLIELFDADLEDGTTNIPKWDPVNAAILGADTPDNYTVYNNFVIGGMISSETAAAFFKPNIPLKSLNIIFENLQDDYAVSYHFYIASHEANAIHDLHDTMINIYPNPCQDKLTLQYSILDTPYSIIEIVDYSGKVVLKQEVGNRDDVKKNVYVGHLPAGIYIVKLHTQDAVGVRKLGIN